MSLPVHVHTLHPRDPANHDLDSIRFPNCCTQLRKGLLCSRATSATRHAWSSTARTGPPKAVLTATLQNDSETHWGEAGPSEQATLKMLEWSRLRGFVADFASTSLGRKEILGLVVARSQETVEQWQAETVAADLIEARYAANVDFGGISTTQAGQAIRRARKGGALTAPQLLAVAGLTVGARKLRRTVNSTAKQAGEMRPDSLLQPILAAVKGMQDHKDLEVRINQAIAEDGSLRDDASDEVSRTRSRVRTVEGRLRSLLKGMGGEPAEQGQRLCLAVPSGGAPPKGVLLGSSSGGSIIYVEPPAAVALNNELAAARGEAYAAEEAVLWNLTGAVMGVVDSLQHILDTVVWLDTIMAKARYGRWIEGTYPTFGRFPANNAPRKKGGKAKSTAQSGEEGDGHWIQLRRLRHPLLLGNWLQSQVEAKRASKGSQSRGISIRRLANRKGNMSNDTDEQSSQGDGNSSADSAAWKPPVPIDVCVRPEVRAVIITGPNTGGKTASLKALGLALLMARSGLPVPAAYPVVLPPFSCVLADIGDEQDLSSSLSTFSGHLRRIQGVRREADGKALVLLDEVGTGTDPAQGAALGVALLKALAKGGERGAAFTLATTHHSALTGLKYEDHRFENASVEFDEEKLLPTFRLLWGIPGRSNAIHTAARIGLEPAIIQAARQRLGIALNKVDNTIAQLEDLRISQERDEDQTTALRQRIARFERDITATRSIGMDMQAVVGRQLRRLEKNTRASKGKVGQVFVRVFAFQKLPVEVKPAVGRLLCCPVPPETILTVPKQKQAAAVASNKRNKISEEEANMQLQRATHTIRAIDQAEAKLQVMSAQKRRQERQQQHELQLAAEEAKKQEEQKRQEEFEQRNPLQPKLGQMVSVPRLKGRAKVVAIDGEEVTLQMGMLKVAAKVKDLKR